MNKKYNTKTDKQYKMHLSKLYDIMNKGETNLTSKEINYTRKLALKVEKYEDQTLELGIKIAK